MKILVLDVNYSGDMLMNSPVFRAIRDNTGTKADFLGWDAGVEVVELNPHVDLLYSFPVGMPSRGILARLRGKKYDLVVNLTTSLKWGAVAKYIGRSLGYDFKGFGRFNTIRVPISHRVYRGGYRPDEVCDLLEKGLGWKVKDRSLILRENANPASGWLDEFAPGMKWVGIHTVCRNTQDRREWKREHWVRLCNMILESDPQVFLFFTGTEGEGPKVENMASMVAYQDRIQNLCGVTNVSQMASMIRSFKCLITINTLPMHIAVAVGTPLVAIVGGTPARVVLPKSDKIRFVEDPALQHWNNGKYTPQLNFIGPREVFELYRGLIG